LRTCLLLASTFCALALAGPALAAPPTLSAVSHQDRHATATFAAPRASSVSIYLASKPDRATDGSFLQENIKNVDFMTDSEIQSGRWVDASRIDPGTYWVMLRASPDFESCYLWDGGGYDPACASGYSELVTLVVPKPAVRYRANATAFRFSGTASLQLVAAPLGEATPYRVCYRSKTKKTRCVTGRLDGYSWESSATDSLTVTTRNLPTFTTFVWYVTGKIVGSKRIRVR
jgi:hypothetical protein